MSPQHPEMRIGDREREAAVSALGEHYAAGRITKEEYDERAERAWAARTNSELHPLFVDLPSLAPRATGRPPAPAQSPSRTRARRVPVLWLVMAAILLVFVLEEAAIPLLVVAAALWFSGAFRRHGSCRRPH
jgi:hypothetical protein